MALLATGVGGAVLAVPAQAATPTITVQLSANPIVADGSSMTTATVTETDASSMPVTGNAGDISFMFGDPGVHVISPVTETGVGTGVYTATIQSSTTVGQVTVTATDSATTVSGSAAPPLTQTVGPASSVVVAVSPNPVVADGTPSTATATVTDAEGHLLSGEPVTFSPGGAGTNTSGGTYEATIPGSDSVDQETVTATDAATGASGSALLTRTIGPASHIAVALSPSAVIANGTSTTVATATVTDAEGHRVPGETIDFVPGGLAADHNNGTYTATIKSTTNPGTVSIMAFDTSTGGVQPGSATLTQQQGTASTSTDLAVATTNPIAGQTVTLIATVTSDQSNIPPIGAIAFENGGKLISGCGRLVAPSSQSVTVFCQTSFSGSTANLMAAFTPSPTASVSGSTSPTTTIEIGKPPPTHSVIRGAITAQMEWSFDHSLRSTKPLVFVIGGVRVGATVTVQCHGHGCPYAKSATTIKRPKSCKQTKKHKCPVTHPGTVNLMRRFHNRQLRIGDKVTIKITQPSFIGKYYTFTMRAGKGPRISIGCIAPGSNRLGVGC